MRPTLLLTGCSSRRVQSPSSKSNDTLSGISSIEPSKHSGSSHSLASVRNQGRIWVEAGATRPLLVSALRRQSGLLGRWEVTPSSLHTLTGEFRLRILLMMVGGTSWSWAGRCRREGVIRVSSVAMEPSLGSLTHSESVTPLQLCGDGRPYS